MSLYQYEQGATLTHDQIPHPGGALVGVILGVAGTIVGAAKLVVPYAVLSFDAAYQVLGLASAICVTLINLYYWRELKRAQTAKAIADLGKLSDDDRDSYKPRRGSNMRDGK